MEQQLFDFSALAAAQRSEETKVSPKIYTVSQLTRELRGILEEHFVDVWVSGEVSNLRKPASGHFYFTLKDASAQIAAVLFRGNHGKIPFQLEDGLEVICHGRLSVYETRGQYQIVVDSCEPKGMGALQLAFEQLKKKLSTEGLFDAKHKKPLPFLPKKIGVVTSASGAALRDILNILKRRFPNVDVLLVPALVQGIGAAQEIALGIETLNQRQDIDVMIVGRGGGSMEDLWAFNEEVVARAIFASRIPVVSAVGHEIDFTIADFVADLRAPTPSAAAELVVPNKQDLVLQLSEWSRQLFLNLKADLEWKQKQLRELSTRLKDPRARFQEWYQRLDELGGRLQLGFKVGWERRDQLLKKLVSNLDHLSPLHILSKGYSVVRKKGKHIPLKSSQELKLGEALEIRLNEGECLAEVLKILS